MTKFGKLEERYYKDPMFHQMVEFIYAQLHEVNLTPSEVREAAMLACIKFEWSHPSYILRYGREE